MSDEYASSGFQGSLVNPSINDILPPREREKYSPSSDYETKNYPPPGDTTSSGGRRTAPLSQPDNGLPITIKQQTGSGSTDLRGQHAYDQSAESLETRKEAAEALAARYRASREKLNEAA